MANQGENDEKNVTVKVAIRGAGKPIELEEKLPEIAAGQTKTVSVPLSSTPPAGQPVTIDVEIARSRARRRPTTTRRRSRLSSPARGAR